jgi:hypothetical protein
MWNLSSFHFEIVFVSMQVRCMVCARCTIGSEISWTHSMEPLGDVGNVESLFRLETVLVLVQDRGTVCAKCTIGSEIILEALDGTLWQ